MLTDAEKNQIREEAEKGILLQDIAAYHGISRMTVWRIINNVTSKKPSFFLNDEEKKLCTICIQDKIDRRLRAHQKIADLILLQEKIHNA